MRHRDLQQLHQQIDPWILEAHLIEIQAIRLEDRCAFVLQVGIIREIENEGPADREVPAVLVGTHSETAILVRNLARENIVFGDFNRADLYIKFHGNPVYAMKLALINHARMTLIWKLKSADPFGVSANYIRSY